ncbi:hypothetical protein PR202_ga22503 [Eleusine coracana subsp. coracana]|uniref:Protein kinase domain-containing protein n=1 Tax=Eleusine coracana subsp. coracana TaxID=191504 RepID=A0AAV5D1W0_ELECO|nr:hypothetical protein PR202_ga22503 [Eleusine coracana subsp. coracana]
MSHFQEKQFKREVDNLMKVQHENIVRFLGYCYESSYQYIEYEATHVFAESSKMLLCFEYVSNGSLDKHINGMSLYINEIVVLCICQMKIACFACYTLCRPIYLVTERTS